MYINLLTKHPEDERRKIIQATRICKLSTMDEGKKDSNLLNSIIKLQHSCLEFGNFMFEVSGMSIVAERQLVRHRVGTSFAIQSLRSTKAQDMDYFVPNSIKNDAQVMDSIRRSFVLYQSLIERGVKMQDARYILPAAVTTKKIISANLRSWIHFWIERAFNKKAQKEIRDFAKTTYDMIIPHIPELEIVSEVAKYQHKVIKLDL